MTFDSNRLFVRIRSVLDEWFVLVVVVLLALSVLGGWGVYTAFAADQDHEPIHQPDDSWSTNAGFDHYAVVQNETPIFEENETVGDRSTYFTAVTPELSGEFWYDYEAQNGDVTIDIELEQVLRSVDETDGTSYWKRNETLETVTVDTVEPGERQSVSFAVNVAKLDNQTAQIEESLGASPGTVEIIVIADVTMTGTVNDESVDHHESYVLSIDPDGDVYHVEWASGTDQAQDDTDPVEPAVASTTGLLGPGASLIVFVGSLTALIIVIVAQSRGILAPSPETIERLRLESERDTFDEWISCGSLPNDVFEQSVVELETLEDLVDVAIDCDRRVIEDGDGYYVVDGALTYAYEPEIDASDDRDHAVSESTEIESSDVVKPT